MRKTVTAAFCLFWLWPAGIWAAPAITASERVTTLTATSTSGFTLVTVDCLTSTSGTCTATIRDWYGMILRATINPDGTDVPTAAYDVTVTDRDAYDVLGGNGADLSATVTTSFACAVNDSTTSATIPTVVFGNHTVSMTGGGSQKRTRLSFIMKP